MPTPPATLRQTLVQSVAATNPGYTDALPASLIEDITSTDVGALVLLDQARVDAINSITPYGANAFVLAEMGAMFGIAQGIAANASVFVVFTGTAGYVLPPGFTVSDGTNQYTLQDGGVIGVSGVSLPLFAIAINPGTFPIPPGTVTQVVTSVATGYTLTVTNPNAGTPALAAESMQSYRSRVLQAFQANATGTPAYLRTLLGQVPGVNLEHVAINGVTGGWQIVCGGGDPFAVANAILNSVPDPTSLQGSKLAIMAMTAANPVVITTNYPTVFAPGSTFTVAGSSVAAYNATYTVASVSGTAITTTTNGSTFSAYTSGAAFSQNPRNVSVSLFQAPDTYNVTFVNPPAHVVTMAVAWNTTLVNFTASSQVNQLAAAALQTYINNIDVGAPINLLEAIATFQTACASVIDPANVSTLEFNVTIDGQAASPTAGTSIIAGDPEGYFTCASTAVTVTQG